MAEFTVDFIDDTGEQSAAARGVASMPRLLNGTSVGPFCLVLYRVAAGTVAKLSDSDNGGQLHLAGHSVSRVGRVFQRSYPQLSEVPFQPGQGI